ncbi:hypothetical protein O181_001930 [Austropuccinia psidii MF-1]|uniref:Uncharacterized protein n=1 Tax=Austropuccinia psidii MF-1 TaxID=1389203 RepID=A0A9Q3BBH0_9BASI|nr:hypothetical protein [Austropuccinia psidii MF-1]
MRFYDPNKKKLRISCDYLMPSPHFKTKARKNIVKLPVPIFKKQILSTAPVASLGSENSMDESTEFPVAPQRDYLKHYEYVAYYDKAHRDISNRISKENILEEGRRQTKNPEQLMLADLVPDITVDVVNDLIK